MKSIAKEVTLYDEKLNNNRNRVKPTTKKVTQDSTKAKNIDAKEKDIEMLHEKTKEMANYDEKPKNPTNIENNNKDSTKAKDVKKN